MARIFYSMAGEGRGHATRVRVMVEALRADHEITLFAPGHAFEILEPLYRDTLVRVVPIPGLLFAYNKRRQVDLLRTTARSLGFAWHLPALRKRIIEEFRRDSPDLAIVDFEPALPRAARACGVPFISFDHQHFLVYNDLSSLPRWLRRHAAFMGLAVRCMYRGQAASIVSSFYQPRLRRGCEHVRQIGVLLREEIMRAQPSRQGHLAAYFRRFSIGRELEAIKAGARGREVRIYGLGERPAEGPLRFMPMDEARLIADLASCEGLVTTAGNQLVGEAMYLGKPVLALPEPKNYEQYINAHFLGESGAGAWAEMERIAPREVESFVGRLDEFRGRIDRDLVGGNRAALEAIRAHLPLRAKAPVAAVAPLAPAAP